MDSVVFGMTSGRVDDEILDEIQDALDEVSEGQWKLLSWRRSAGTRFIVYAPLQCRTIVNEHVLKVRIWPLGQLLDDMGDQRNEWITSRNLSIPDIRQTVDQWYVDMWSQLETLDDAPENEPNSSGTKQGEVVSIDSENEGMSETSKRPKMSVVKEQPKDTVLRAFGLTGNEKDSEGNPLSFYTLKDEQQ